MSEIGELAASMISDAPLHLVVADVAHQIAFRAADQLRRRFGWELSQAQWECAGAPYAIVPGQGEGIVGTPYPRSQQLPVWRDHECIREPDLQGSLRAARHERDSRWHST